tara:strand:- start:1822 stop:2187 length:366 start_codon:yes stop_codon:yes gene_type:complete
MNKGEANDASGHMHGAQALTPGGSQAAYMSPDRGAANATNQYASAAANGGTMPLTSPRNAIGGISGMPISTAQYTSNIMSRRKSNAMTGAHGPVDLSQLMRAQRSGRNDGDEGAARAAKAG